MDAYRAAYNTWQEKTEWVQKDKRFDVLLPWGKHRADVMKEYIDHLEAKLDEALRYGRQADVTIHNLELKITDMAVQLANAESKCAALAAENATKQEFIATCFRAAADGGSMDGAEIQELGERLGLFGRETYQPVLHGYICGHEAGEDTVYVMKKSPATDTFLAEVRASAIDHAAAERWGSGYIFNELNELAAQIRKGVQS